LLEVGGVPLWQRQLQVLRELLPAEIFISASHRSEWASLGHEVIADLQDDIGPLAGLVASLHRSAHPLLLALAVDLPNMSADYLRGLLQLCAHGRGVVATGLHGFEPLAAVYPKESLPLAESFVCAERFSLQDFAAHCVAGGLLIERAISPSDEPLFLNVNTPTDFASIAHG